MRVGNSRGIPAGLVHTIGNKTYYYSYTDLRTTVAMQN